MFLMSLQGREIGSNVKVPHLALQGVSKVFVLIENAMYRTLLALSLRTKAARSLVVTSPLQKTTRFFLTFVVLRKKRSVREVNHFACES